MFLKVARLPGRLQTKWEDARRFSLMRGVQFRPRKVFELTQKSVGVQYNVFDLLHRCTFGPESYFEFGPKLRIRKNCAFGPLKRFESALSIRIRSNTGPKVHL